MKLNLEEYGQLERDFFEKLLRIWVLNLAYKLSGFFFGGGGGCLTFQ